MSPSPLVELHDATIGYDGRPVLSGISLAVGAGEVVAVLGANGSGKSTLIRGILGLADLQHGRIDLFGTDAGPFRERWRIGYVPQRTAIAGALPATVREVVTSGRLPRLGLVRRLSRSDREAVDAAIETVELGDSAEVPVAELSGGQQRRVTIARALASEPELLVLDEPTAGVDAETQARLAGTLEQLSTAGTTIVLIAHELGPVSHLIRRVVVMRDGGVAFDGPRDLHPDDGHTHGEIDTEHHHEHGEAPLRPGTGLAGW